MNISPALSEPPDIILTELAGLRTRSGDATESRGRNMVTAVDISQILIKTGRQELAFKKKMDVTVACGAWAVALADSVKVRGGVGGANLRFTNRRRGLLCRFHKSFVRAAAAL